MSKYIYTRSNIDIPMREILINNDRANCINQADYDLIEDAIIQCSKLIKIRYADNDLIKHDIDKLLTYKVCKIKKKRIVHIYLWGTSFGLRIEEGVIVIYNFYLGGAWNSKVYCIKDTEQLNQIINLIFEYRIKSRLFNINSAHRRLKNKRIKNLKNVAKSYNV